jgi:hypothetical protein
LVQCEQSLAQALQEMEGGRQKVTALEDRLASLRRELDENQKARQLAEDSWIESADVRCFAASVRPMSPEQMIWSLLQATGELSRHLSSALHTAEQNLPPSPTILQDSEEFLDKYLADQTKVALSTFAGLFGHSAGSPQADFFATVDQALFLSNADLVQSWLTPTGGNLIDRLNKMDNPDDLAVELYLSVLTRYPTDRERADVGVFLQSHAKDRSAAVPQLAWGLLTSAEFRFIH